MRKEILAAAMLICSAAIAQSQTSAAVSQMSAEQAREERATGAAVAHAQVSLQAPSYSASELARRTIERRAVEAVIWGMPIVSIDAMRRAFFRDAKASYGDIVYWSKPSDWKNQTTTPNASNSMCTSTSTSRTDRWFWSFQRQSEPDFMAR
jgi:hypothetical protein